MKSILWSILFFRTKIFSELTLFRDHIIFWDQNFKGPKYSLGPIILGDSYSSVKLKVKFDSLIQARPQLVFIFHWQFNKYFAAKLFCKKVCFCSTLMCKIFSAHEIGLQMYKVQLRQRKCMKGIEAKTFTRDFRNTSTFLNST